MFDFIIFYIVDFLICIIPILISVAFLTLLERKVLANIQKRRGPNIVGFFGILQPIADGIKLLFKEVIIPFNSNKLIFYLSPVFVFLISIFSWTFIPFNNNFYSININFSVFLYFAVSSLGVYGIILAGWSSNSKYAFLGSIRAIAQMLSYELTLFLSIVPVLFISESLNFIEVVEIQKYIWFIYILPTSAFCFFISLLAETNRTPFDLPEAEGELVAGYNIEFSSMVFALFFLAEYSNILIASALFSIFFLGGWNDFFFFSGSLLFAVKITFIATLFIIVRGILPRYRFDQLINLSWLVILPICLGNFLFILILDFIIQLFCF
jgi:NADH-quinone oxidoreductase subunit H